MIRKFLPSDNVNERLVCRDGHFSVFDGRLLDAGGFLVDSQWAGLKSFDEIVKAGNAIIVAEGGMGKSHVQRLFCESRQDQSLVKRIELVSYAHNEQGLTDAIMAAARNKEYLFLDGLDEAGSWRGLAPSLFSGSPRVPVRGAVFLVFNVDIPPVSQPSEAVQGHSGLPLTPPSRAPAVGARLESRTSRTWVILSLVFRSLFVPFVAKIPPAFLPTFPPAGRTANLSAQ